eukprot:CAMPEP_0180784650 /NCGR_PEP_ID=MMETSP1038_2-20121128/49726_1 /TAXON_ID=632150 /ORGANISM="Azadinium spinosum, Strain 3D9" /LENGTH=171 /DNA_ID=CAMNT_0022821411 /DNA_START=96 /DNA_END=608 /DNA_ORIENTATION=-
MGATQACSDISGPARGEEEDSERSSASSAVGGAAPPVPLGGRRDPRAVRELPNPAFVPHVTTEHHLEVARLLENAERIGADLDSQVASLRTALGDSEVLAKGKEAAEKERDRLLEDLREVREDLAQSKFAQARLNRELAEAKADRGPLAARLEQRTLEATEAKVHVERLER